MLFPFSPSLADVAHAARLVCANYGPRTDAWTAPQVILTVLLVLIVLCPWLTLSIRGAMPTSHFIGRQLFRVFAVGVLVGLLAWGGFFP